MQTRNKTIVYRVWISGHSTICYTPSSRPVCIGILLQAPRTPFQEQSFLIYPNSNAEQRQTEVRLELVKSWPGALKPSDVDIILEYHRWAMWLINDSNQGELFPTRPLTSRVIVDTVEPLLVPLTTSGDDWDLDRDFLHDLRRYKGIGQVVPTSDLLRCVNTRELVRSKHDHRMYTIEQICRDISISSETHHGGKVPTSYEMFFRNKKRIYTFHDKSQPMLKLTHVVTRPSNVLIPPLYKIAPSNDAKSRAFEIVPAELCYYNAVPRDYLVSLSYMPSIVFRLMSLVRASEVGFVVGCSLNPSIALQAITCPSVLEDGDYESLETLGDSFLKLVTSRAIYLSTTTTSTEGDMTIQKCKLISNATLCELMRTKGFRLLELVRTERFVQLPAKTLLHPALKHRPDPFQLPNKTCADIAEALMGAYFIDSGESAALQFLQWLGLDLPSEFEYIVMSPSKTTIMQLHHQRCSRRNDGLMAEKGCHWLTIEALTHLSCGLPYSNQRLEFLGDAVLDFITTVQLWKMFPNQTPGTYTVWRSQVVCNQTLGRVAAKMGLATSIIHNCANTSAQLAPFRNGLDDYTMSSAAVVYPKVLADAFEAIVGSQYLQSCCSLKSVWASIKEHILPELMNLQGGCCKREKEIVFVH